MAESYRRRHLKSKRKSDALVFLSNIPLDGPGHDVLTLRNSESLGKIKDRVRSEEEFTNNQNRHGDGPDEHQISSRARARHHVGSEEVLVHRVQDEAWDKAREAEHTSLTRVFQRRNTREEIEESNFADLQKNRSLSVHISQEKGLISAVSPDRVPSLSSSGGSSGNVRMVLISNHKSPYAIFSFLSYNKRLRASTGRYENESNINLRSRTRKHSGIHQISVSEDLLVGLNTVEGDGKTVSYCHFLVPTRENLHMQHMQPKYFGGQDISTLPLPHSPAVKKFTTHPLKTAGLPPSPTKIVDGENIFHDVLSVGHLYDPNIVDDPELSSGKHKKVLTFPSYMVSIIEHTKPSELKKDLNEQFADRFPHINLTLSKLRSIKKDMWKICMDCNVEPAILAQAYAYYEKLVLNGKIQKQNRKLCAGASLLLSVKLNDVRRSDLDSIVKEIEERFRVSRKELFSYEFPVLVALEFSLHLAEFEILPHYKRIIQLT
ncbi:CDK5 and ABL1 enzyme substrate 2-like [Anneissia japonica]|uniref:CDK5 and ABL1 enzyme substrate 2-like n=1 Tax=Anneissia japonica TaxID=1529436 RepID=UPI0014257DAA|nr:CDK5 and ABL1 enzyme substrate 2-like [Anneissia japonica]